MNKTYSSRASRPAFGFGIMLAVIWLVASPLLAHDPEPVPADQEATGSASNDNKEEKKNQEGDKGKESNESKFLACDPPKFSVVWTGYNSFKVVAKAKPAQTFVVDLSLTEPDEALLKVVQQHKCPEGITPIKEGNSLVRFCVPATEEGTATMLTISSRSPLLRSGGLFGLHYEALAEDILPKCPQRNSGPRDPSLKALDKHSLGFDVGLVYNLEGNGEFESNAEATFFARSQWSEGLLAGVEARYSAIQPSEEPAAADDGGGGDGAGNGETSTMEEEPDPSTFNPFANEGGGVLEADVYLSWSPHEGARRLGYVFGAGFSTVPGETDFANVKTRYYAGLRVNVEGFNHKSDSGNHLNNARGNAQLVFARDDLYEAVVLQEASEDGTVPAVISDESDRIRLTSELELPGVGTDWLRIVLRGHASLPTSGHGPSDIRFSALASIDPRQWFGVGKGKGDG